MPRFEFRACARNLDPVADRIRARAPCEGLEESSECYLVGAAEGGRDHNVKIRRNALDVKRLVEQRGILERWKPGVTESLPLSATFLREFLVPILGIDQPQRTSDDYGLVDLIRHVILPQPGCVPVWVGKRRFRFHLGACPAEIDELTINGAAIASVAVESEDAQALRGAIASVGLDAYENVNYPRAIRRIVGLETYAGQPWHEDSTGEG